MRWQWVQCYIVKNHRGKSPGLKVLKKRVKVILNASKWFWSSNSHIAWWISGTELGDSGLASHTETTAPFMCSTCAVGVISRFLPETKSRLAFPYIVLKDTVAHPRPGPDRASEQLSSHLPTRQRGFRGSAQHQKDVCAYNPIKYTNHWGNSIDGFEMIYMKRSGLWGEEKAEKSVCALMWLLWHNVLNTR